MPFRSEGGLRDPGANRSLPLIADDLSRLPTPRQDVAGQWGYKLLTGPLFNTDLNPYDIIQGNIGDCFLLAALLSILEYSTGQEYINNMMCDLGDSVVVRLYKMNPTVEAVYYRVPKTRIVSSAGVGNPHRANWVHILEKVYAYHRTQHGGNCYVPVEEKILWRRFFDGRPDIKYYKREYREARVPANLIEALTGGHCDEVYQFIFGVKSDNKHLHGDIIDPSCPQLYHLFCLFTNITPNQSLQQGGNELGGNELAAVAAIFGDPIIPENALMIQDFLDAIPSTLDSITTFNNNFHEGQVPRFEELLKFCESGFGSLKDKTREKLMNYIHRHVPRKRGLGDYILRQTRCFHGIAHKMHQGQLVCASTTDKIGRVDMQGERREFTGEAVVRGLVGTHAYQIIDCYERVDPGTNIALKFLLVRNPWQECSRKYIFCQHETNPVFLKRLTDEQREEIIRQRRAAGVPNADNVRGSLKIYSPVPHLERVLHSERADFPPSTALAKAKNWLMPYRYQPIPWPRRNSAMHISEARLAQFFEEPGISEIELCDFMKRFDHLYSVIPPWVAP